MAKSRSFVLKLILLIFVILITVLFLSYRLLVESLPKTKGQITLQILESPVNVYRDQFGIPHIFAENEIDLFKAMGYVTAQDRLWQMDFYRRAATGRLSEIFGESTIESDTYIRTLGLNRMAQKLVTYLSPESRLAMTAYVEGVNAFIETNLDRLPIEFSLLKYKPDKWKIVDCLAFSRLLAWKLSFSWYVDLVLDQLVKKVGLQKARDVFPDFPKQGPVIIPATNKSFSKNLKGFLHAGLEFRNLLGAGTAQTGSNSWVVSGEKSYCGKPLLANDPHLEIRVPSVWYEIHLSGGGIKASGVSFPGTPGILIGHNEHIAWGSTNGMVDDVDFYIEKVNPENANQYWSGKEWVDFEQVEETIAVKNGKPIRLTIQISRNGPIISNIHSVLKNKTEVVAMRWTGYQPSDELTAVLKMQEAKSWHDFTNALQYFKVPAQNFIFASTAGDIGYYLAGLLPIRRNATGILPHNGWLKTGQWIDEVPFEKLPHVLNPSENFIVTANNKIVNDSYPYYITNLWEPPARAARIHQLLSEKEKFTIEDFKNMQSDVVSLHAQEIMPILKNTVQAKLDSVSDEHLEMLFNLIKEWDGRESGDSVATAIFHAFFLKLTEDTLKDEMGDELYQNYIRLGNVPFRVIPALLKNKKTTWFDNVSTPIVETPEDIIVLSLRDAGALLKNIAGENISDWAWGKVHSLKMSHPLGNRRPLDTVFNLGPFERSGSNTTINNGEYRFQKPFKVVLGASTRQLVDLCDIKNSWSIITSGQSGQRMDSHYKDQTSLWLEGKYHRMSMDSLDIVQSAPEHLLLKPQ